MNFRLSILLLLCHVYINYIMLCIIYHSKFKISLFFKYANYFPVILNNENVKCWISTRILLRKRISCPLTCISTLWERHSRTTSLFLLLVLMLRLTLLFMEKRLLFLTLIIISTATTVSQRHSEACFVNCRNTLLRDKDCANVVWVSPK